MGLSGFAKTLGNTDSSRFGKNLNLAAFTAYLGNNNNIGFRLNRVTRDYPIESRKGQEEIAYVFDEFFLTPPGAKRYHTICSIR